MDYAQEHYKAYIGRHISELPTPALVVSLPLIKRNIQALHNDVEKLGIGFRPHIKTLKVRYSPAVKELGTHVNIDNEIHDGIG
jgi:D-serine deaminase-like pyridoxal phosphate-dependent protein